LCEYSTDEYSTDEYSTDEYSTDEYSTEESYGDSAMKRETVYESIDWFRDERQSDDDDDDARGDRPSTSRVHDPKSLTEDVKQLRVACCKEWKEENNFLNKVITGDDMWICDYDPKTKMQIEKRKRIGLSKPEKARKNCKNIKMRLIVFFDIQGVVYYEFFRENQKANGKYYVKVLNRLCEEVQRKRPEKRNWILHHDNAPWHTASIVREFIDKKGIIVANHPPRSPDLAPCDFFFIP